MPQANQEARKKNSYNYYIRGIRGDIFQMWASLQTDQDNA